MFDSATRSCLPCSFPQQVQVRHCWLKVASALDLFAPRNIQSKVLLLHVHQLPGEVQPCRHEPPCSAQLGALQAGACVCPANGSTLCVPPDMAGGDLGFVAAQLGVSFDASRAFQVSRVEPVMQTRLQLLFWYSLHAAG